MIIDDINYDVQYLSNNTLRIHGIEAIENMQQLQGTGIELPCRMEHRNIERMMISRILLIDNDNSFIELEFIQTYPIPITELINIELRKREHSNFDSEIILKFDNDRFQAVSYNARKGKVELADALILLARSILRDEGIS